MNIGIIVYSQTGHTLEVCEQLKDRYVAAGHDVVLDRVTIRGERTPQTKTFELDAVPDPVPYDAVVLASYVEAFSLCPVMKHYLVQLGTLADTPVACLVTQQFPYPWLGGNRALKQMRKLVEAKNGVVGATAVVNWATAKRAATMAAALERLTTAF